MKEQNENQQTLKCSSKLRKIHSKTVNQPATTHNLQKYLLMSSDEIVRVSVCRFDAPLGSELYDVAMDRVFDLIVEVELDEEKSLSENYFDEVCFSITCARNACLNYLKSPYNRQVSFDDVYEYLSVEQPPVYLRTEQKALEVIKQLMQVIGEKVTFTSFPALSEHLDYLLRQKRTITKEQWSEARLLCNRLQTLVGGV